MRIAFLAALVLALLPASALGATAHVEGAGTWTLLYDASPGEANQLEVTIDSDVGVVTLHDSGATITAGNGCTAVNANEVTCQPVDRAIVIRLGDRADELRLTEGGVELEAYGGVGSDELNACPDCSARFFGGTGNDDLGGDHALLTGGGGADTLISVFGGVVGGDGDDILTSDSFSLFGGAGDDLITGGAGENRVDAGTGDDTVRAGAGRDELLGRAGRDRLFGERGNDRLLARDGERDVVSGGRGYDVAQVDRRLDRLRSIQRLIEALNLA